MAAVILGREFFVTVLRSIAHGRGGLRYAQCSFSTRAGGKLGSICPACQARAAPPHSRADGDEYSYSG